jgi:hypothetical protein
MNVKPGMAKSSSGDGGAGAGTCAGTSATFADTVSAWTISAAVSAPAGRSSALLVKTSTSGAMSDS